MIRDPDVSFDGQRILFAWRQDAGDDFHLYHYQVADGQIRQLTAGKGFADYQGKYLPDGGIVFSSTRCVQTSDCIDIDVSNLYRCNADGSGIRRLGFDQASTCFPSVLNDGRILYTRREYQDRGQIFPQPLFAMHPDGTAQVGYYGNNLFSPRMRSGPWLSGLTWECPTAATMPRPMPGLRQSGSGMNTTSRRVVLGQALGSMPRQD